MLLAVLTYAAKRLRHPVWLGKTAGALRLQMIAAESFATIYLPRRGLRPSAAFVEELAGKFQRS